MTRPAEEAERGGEVRAAHQRRGDDDEQREVGHHAVVGEVGERRDLEDHGHGDRGRRGCPHGRGSSGVSLPGPPALITGRSPCVSGSTTTPTRSSEVKSTKGAMSACAESWRGLLCTAVDLADRDAGDVRRAVAAAPGDHHVVAGRGGRRGRRDRGRGGRRRRPGHARAGSRSPCVEPSRPPTTDSWSTMSSTVAVVRSARTTRPTRPSLLSTVMSGWMPEEVPASMVTVRVNDWAGPIATTRAGTRA